MFYVGKIKEFNGQDKELKYVQNFYEYCQTCRLLPLTYMDYAEKDSNMYNQIVEAKIAINGLIYQRDGNIFIRQYKDITRTELERLVPCGNFSISSEEYLISTIEHFNSGNNAKFLELVAKFYRQGWDYPIISHKAYKILHLYNPYFAQELYKMEHDYVPKERNILKEYEFFIPLFGYQNLDSQIIMDLVHKIEATQWLEEKSMLYNIVKKYIDYETVISEKKLDQLFLNSWYKTISK